MENEIINYMVDCLAYDDAYPEVGFTPGFAYIQYAEKYFKIKIDSEEGTLMLKKALKIRGKEKYSFGSPPAGI